MQTSLTITPSTLPQTPEAAIAAALDLIAELGIDGIGSAFALLAEAGVDSAGEAAQGVLVEALFHLIDGFEADPAASAAHEIIAALDPALAEAGLNLLFLVNFPDGQGAVADLSDSAALCMAALVVATGAGADALAFIVKAETGRQTARFLGATQRLRARAFGFAGGIAPLWLEPIAGPDDIAAAREAIDARPLDLAAHRALVRHLAEAGELKQAASALMVALALPLGDAEKAGFGADLGVLATYLRATGQYALFASQGGARYALGACPGVAAECEATLKGLTRTGAWQAIDQDRIDATARDIAAFSTHVPAYPMNGDKPHIDTVWLEITNFCNQKCTFCPDMHREDARQWLPLDRIKAIIDELASTVSVGSMQLNAYGEPLLHPNIQEILAYIREKQLPFHTYFTTHGMTLVEKKLKQLSRNYPQGIAVSMHNDSQDSYERTRSAKIGDYQTLVTRIEALFEQMVNEGAGSHLRLYQMVCNGKEDMKVPPEVRAGFAHDVERFERHVRQWEAAAARIAAQAPAERQAQVIVNSAEHIRECFEEATSADGYHIPLMVWTDEFGQRQNAFISARPVGTYANLLLEYHPTWQVERKLLNKQRCWFPTQPSLAIFATGKLGICCLDMNSTATFGALDDFGSIRAAVESVEAKRIFAQLSNGVAVSRGCQICLASGKQLCGPAN